MNEIVFALPGATPPAPEPPAMIPSRQAGDILAGMWLGIAGAGKVTRTLVWDREGVGVGGGVRRDLGHEDLVGSAEDPEFKGMVERNNQFLETSFLPGRRFGSPADFNAQLTEWLVKANARTVRSIAGRPVDRLATDLASMVPLPPAGPTVGLQHRVRLGRDYYVRVDTCDYSIDPRVIGRFVDVTASATTVTALCDGRAVARHERSWAKAAVVTDPAHAATAKAMRGALAQDRARRGRDPPPRRRPRSPTAGAAGLRRAVRRRLHQPPSL